MDAKNFVVDDSRQAQVVEDLRTVSPHVHRPVFPQTLIVETVHLSDLTGFVVASDKSNTIGIADLTGVIRNVFISSRS